MSEEAQSAKSHEVRVVLYGVGVIGSSIARLLLKKRGVKIVGAIDASPDKVGKDLGEVIGSNERLGITVSRDLSRLMSKVKADIAVQATSSFLRDVHPQLVELIQHGLDVVSTCEELSYPQVSDWRLAAELDKLSKKHNVTVLGTGVNPGFVMDTLPITLTGVCQEIEQIRVERVMDAATRRIPFQKKVGVGLTVEQFREKIEKGQITGHVGLTQSVAMLAGALGWKLQRIEVGSVEPVLAEGKTKTEGAKLEKGQVAGLRQSACGVMANRKVIELDFQAYVGAKEEYDAVTIRGIPNISQKISPCVHGDLATAAIIVNSIPKVLNAAPGLKTMKDLPIPSAVLEDMNEYIDNLSRLKTK